MKKFLLLIVGVFLSAKTLWLYCGVTMKQPMLEIAHKFEELHPGVKVRHLFGSSGVLYKKILTLRKADLYLPGSDKFIKKNPSLFIKGAELGYNQLAIFVPKGNPKNVQTLSDFAKPSINTGLGSEHSSVGKASKSALVKYGGKVFYQKIRNKSEIFSASADMYDALVHNEIDAGLNWKATYYWGENSKKVDFIEIPTLYAPKKKLILAITKYSKDKNLAQQFLDFASSKEGLAIMKKWGFR
ncbi:MAG: extracellular solute-binding protein [Nautiliaceae bacterium]